MQDSLGCVILTYHDLRDMGNLYSKKFLASSIENHAALLISLQLPYFDYLNNVIYSKPCVNDFC